MTRVLGIEISGDYNSTAIKEATAGVETFGRTVNEAAAKNIERLAAQRIKLQELAGEYRMLAATAKTGSAEQVAALDLAAKAQQRLGTETLATNRAIRTSAKETALAERESAKFARGVASRSGAFGKLGFGLALGSGGFLAGAATAGAVKASIDAAKELMDAEEQLAVAAKNVGVSLDRKQLDEYLSAESKVSLFTKAELTQSLVGLVRATGDVSKAQADATLAANIARATHKNLADVTQGLINLEGGRTRSLVALGVKIPVVKTATDALTASGKVFTGQQRAEAAALDRAATAAEGKRILMQRYHGASEAYAKSDASAQDKLREAENKLAVAVGTVLLPVVKQIADPFAKWAQKEADSGDAARKTKEIVHDLTGVLHTAKDVIHGVDSVTGSFKHTLELLIGLKVASVFAGWIGSIGKLAGAWRGVTTAAEGAAAAEGTAIGGPLALTAGVLGFAGYEALRGSRNVRMPDGSVVTENGLRGGLITVSPAPSGAASTRAGEMRGAGVSHAAYPAGKTYDKAQIAALWVKAGGEPGMAWVMADIAVRGESGGKSSATNLNTNGTIDRGIFQINSSHGYGLSSFDPLSNARQAVSIFHSQGLAAWTDPVAAAYLARLGNHPMGSKSAIDAIIAQGKPKKHKPTILHGSALIDNTLLDKITGDANTARDSSGSVAEMWLRREKADLEKARAHVAAKLKGSTGKQRTAIEGELRNIDTKIAGVNKEITTNLKEQANAIKANAATAIGTAKANIASAFGQIITDAQSAFSKETQDYIDNVLSSKYLQGTDSHGMRLQTASEKKLADMQAADTQQQLQDALDAAKKQLADDTTGALVQHVVDISTGASKDIFGPAGTSAQKALDQKAIEAAQRALEENQVAIDAAKERAQEDYDYSQAVKGYQQERSLAESAMVESLRGLEKGVENGTASINDVNGVLSKFGVSISDIPTDQWTQDWANLSTATETLVQVMLDEAKKLAALGDGSGSKKVQDTADAIDKKLALGSATYNPKTGIVTTAQGVDIGPGKYGGLSGSNIFAFKALGGLKTAADGLVANSPMLNLAGRTIFGEAGPEAYLPLNNPRAVAQIRSALGGGQTIHVTINAPNYVGSHAELAAVLKSPALVETVATAVLMANRRGHIRASQLN